MVTQVVVMLINIWTQIYDFMMDGGILTMFPVLLLVLRKLGNAMSQFTN